MLVRLPVEAVPLVVFVPDHAPEAVQLVAFVLLHVSVDPLPLATELGFAERFTIGAGVPAFTVTVADVLAVPPAPVQLNEYVLVLVRLPVEAMPLVTFAPDHAPEALQLVAFVLLQVRVEPLPLVTDVGLAERLTVGTGVLAVTVTVTELLADPPAPLQFNEYVRVRVRLPVEAVPLVAFEPNHEPEAEQLVALVLLHVSVELLPLVTEVGFAERLTVGVGVAAVTVTVADLLVDPPAPVQLNEYVLVLVRLPVEAVPLVACAPDHAPEAVQLVAFEVLHVSVEPLPLVTEAGFAERLTVGAGVPAVTVTVADLLAVPPLPVQLSEKVVVRVRAPVDPVPLVGFVPDHPPEAVQLVAPVLDQLRAEDWPEVTEAGLTESDTVGAAPEPPLPLPPVAKTSDWVCHPSPPPLAMSHAVTLLPPDTPAHVPTSPLAGMLDRVVQLDPAHWLTSRRPGEPEGQ